MSGKRFTLDGRGGLERHLARVCKQVLADVLSLIPPSKLEGLVLGGGYGRGEGGVLRTAAGERPYNDLDFYVFVRGNLRWHEWRYREPLSDLAERLSAKAGLHVEFKLDSVARLRRSVASMFSYDMVAAHRLIHGAETLFAGCEHLGDATRIPSSEATRLLFNRCSGLLLAGEILREGGATFAALSPVDTPADFIQRNMAKARLALGDAMLTALGQYHWSCLERGRRLIKLGKTETPFLDEILKHHAAGIEFKLHPRIEEESPEALAKDLGELSALAQGLWLWLESRRLNFPFASARDYALNNLEKCSGSGWRNYLLNLKSFGLNGAFGSLAKRYPRERLFNALALLLWHRDNPGEPTVLEELRRLLGTNSSERAGLVQAYAEVWPGYG